MDPKAIAEALNTCADALDRTAATWCDCPQPSTEPAPRVAFASRLFDAHTPASTTVWAQACWDAAAEALADGLDHETALILAMTFYVGRTQ